MLPFSLFDPGQNSSLMHYSLTFYVGVIVTLSCQQNMASVSSMSGVEETHSTSRPVPDDSVATLPSSRRVTIWLGIISCCWGVILLGLGMTVLLQMSRKMDGKACSCKYNMHTGTN